MGLHFAHLLAHILFQIIERVEVSRFTGNCTHLVRKLRTQLVFIYLQQAAVRVIDDDELLRVEQVMRDDQGADGVVGGDASGVTDHVRVSGTEPEAVLEQDAGVHTGEHRGVAAWAHLQIAQVETAREDFVGG